LRDNTKRSMKFLAAYNASGDLAPAYFYAYAALETAVGAAEGKRAFTLGSSRWDRLRKRLETDIDEFLKGNVTNQNELATIAEKIKKKLPELRRVAITDRVKDLCATMRITTSDLWPNFIGFEAGLDRATMNRNLLVHGSRTFPDQMDGDALRLAMLTERILLRLLKWPDEKVWKWNDQPLRWMNADEEETRSV
jgi:hypothetical protein